MVAMCIARLSEHVHLLKEGFSRMTGSSHTALSSHIVQLYNTTHYNIKTVLMDKTLPLI